MTRHTDPGATGSPDPEDWLVTTRLADAEEPVIRRWAERSIERAAAALTATELDERMFSGTPPDVVVKELPFEEWFATDSVMLADEDPVNLEDILARIIARAADAADVGDAAPAAWSSSDDDVVRAARRRAARSVTGLSRTSREAVGQAMAQAIRGRMGRAEAMQVLSDVVGLTRPQAAALIAYRDGLGRFASGELTEQALRAQWETAPRPRTRNLTGGQVDDLAAGYRDRLRSHRALAIARTETMYAANAGRQLAFERALAAGDIPNAVKVWVVTQDDRTCPECASLEGALVDVMFELFVDPVNGTTVQHPPLHTNCRCTIALKTIIPGLALSAP